MNSGTGQNITRQNNFDLIRLVAASQVMLEHGVEHFGVKFPEWLSDFVYRFPGVPIFFVISGFLISRSFERHPNISHYARNRILRIYPALYVCLGFSILTVVVTGYLSSSAVTVSSFVLWLAAQLSILQFFRPGFLNGYATGTLNGSLWTITVELQFYIFLPMLYWFLGRRKQRTLWLVFLIALFMAANVIRYGPAITLDLTNPAKAFKMSVVPYYYIFLLGVICQQNIDVLLPYLRGKVLYWTIAYVAVSYGTDILGLDSINNAINPINVLVLCGLTLSAAFTAPELAEKILRKNDISYGIYIYHMPIANVLIYYSVGGLWVPIRPGPQMSRFSIRGA